jgi:hypothetical protein
MNYSNPMLSGVRAHRVGVVEPKTQVHMLARTPLNSHQQPVLLDRLFDNMVTKSLNRSDRPLLPAFIPTHVRHFKVNAVGVRTSTSPSA